VCRETPGGRTYIGHVNKTVSGRQCQQWSSNFPHEEASFHTNDQFPDGTREAALNYCRNPYGEKWSETVWCYTMDPNMLWELCDVPECGESVSASWFYDICMRDPSVSG